jgi:hypothetical protein
MLSVLPRSAKCFGFRADNWMMYIIRATLNKESACRNFANAWNELQPEAMPRECHSQSRPIGVENGPSTKVRIRTVAFTELSYYTPLRNGRFGRL